MLYEFWDHSELLWRPQGCLGWDLSSIYLQQGCKVGQSKIMESINEQECIPVGCVPPTRYRTTGSMSGGLPGQRPPDRDPLDREPPWTDTPWIETPQTKTPLQRPPRQRPSPGQRPPWTETPWSCDLWCMLGQRPPHCEQNHRQV